MPSTGWMENACPPMSARSCSGHKIAVGPSSNFDSTSPITITFFGNAIIATDFRC